MLWFAAGTRLPSGFRHFNSNDYTQKGNTFWSVTEVLLFLVPPDSIQGPKPGSKVGKSVNINNEK